MDENTVIMAMAKELSVLSCLPDCCEEGFIETIKHKCEVANKFTDEELHALLEETRHSGLAHFFINQ